MIIDGLERAAHHNFDLFTRANEPLRTMAARLNDPLNDRSSISPRDRAVVCAQPNNIVEISHFFYKSSSKVSNFYR